MGFLRRTKPDGDAKGKREPQAIDINSAKYIKPQKDTGRKVLRVILWAVLIFIFASGTLALARPDPVGEMQRRQDTFIRQQQEQENLLFEITSFAQNFAQEYLSYEAGRIDDYIRRVSPFVSNHLTFSGIQNFRHTARATYVQAYRVEQYSANQYDVFIRAIIEYLPGPAAGTDTEAAIERETTALKVPVRVLAPGAYIVEDYPVFIAVPGGYLHNPVPFSGQEVDRTVNAEIERVLVNFLQIYYEHNQTRIDFFLSPRANNAAFRALNGRYTFHRLDNLRSFRDPERPDHILSLVTITILDRNGQQLTQRFNLLLHHDDDRYLIVDKDTRVVDLRYNFGR